MCFFLRGFNTLTETMDALMLRQPTSLTTLHILPEPLSWNDLPERRRPPAVNVEPLTNLYIYRGALSLNLDRIFDFLPDLLDLGLLNFPLICLFRSYLKISEFWNRCLRNLSILYQSYIYTYIKSLLITRKKHYTRFKFKLTYIEQTRIIKK